jgi:hypothetical protein
MPYLCYVKLTIVLTQAVQRPHRASGRHTGGSSVVLGIDGILYLLRASSYNVLEVRHCLFSWTLLIFDILVLVTWFCHSRPSRLF